MRSLGTSDRPTVRAVSSRHREGLLTHPGAPVRAGDEPDGRLARGDPALRPGLPELHEPPVRGRGAVAASAGPGPDERPHRRHPRQRPRQARRHGARRPGASRRSSRASSPSRGTATPPPCSRSTAPASSSTRSSASASPRSGTSDPGGCTRCPGSIADIPSIDAVLISHDHYDHLDQPSIVRLEETHRPHYVVPLGVNAHLLAWGVPEERITALDWRGETEVAGIRLTCTEARHNSGRGLVDSQTLWAGWALHGPRHSAYYRRRLRHVEALRRHRGRPRPLRPDAHARRRLRPVLARHPHGSRAGPRGAPRRQPHRRRDARPDRGRRRGGRRLHRGGPAHRHPRAAPTRRASAPRRPARCRPPPASRSSCPVHWATFNLSMHWWAEPVRRIRRGAAEARVPVAFPRVGERVDLTSGDADAVAAAHSEPVVGAVRGARGPRLTGPPRRHTAYGSPGNSGGRPVAGRE